MTDYAKLKVTELKDLLKERGIPSTGLSRKQQIIEALEADDANPDKEAEEEEEQVKKDEESGGNEDGKADDSPVAATDTAPGATVEPEQANDDGAVVGHGPSDSQISGSEPAVDAQTTAISSNDMDVDAPVSNVIAAATTEPDQDDKPTIAHDKSDFPSTATPEQATRSASTVSSEGKKRKRRSPSPTISEESIIKKLKTAEEKDNSFPAEAASHEYQGDEPMGEPDVPSVKGSHYTAIPSKGGSALHPTTEALYIRNLVRPLQPQQLRDHLIELATPETSEADQSIITAFHVDSLRSHAFAVFTSVSTAIRVRSSLHESVWPSEPTRKALWVDFVPQDKALEWINIEVESSNNRRDAKRWEVVYQHTNTGIEASLQDASTSVSTTQAGVGEANQPGLSQPSVGPGMPNAPTGPRGRRHSPGPDAAPLQKPQPAAQPQGNTGSFDVLDERFKFTATKPKLYYLPVNADLVGRRLDELSSLSGKDWDDKRHGSFSFGDNNLRRFTFEDGDRLVDGGPDIGNFGKRPGALSGDGGGRGGGGGGFGGGRNRGRGRRY